MMYDRLRPLDEFNHWLHTEEALLETLDDCEIDLSCILGARQLQAEILNVASTRAQANT